MHLQMNPVATQRMLRGTGGRRSNEEASREGERRRKARRVAAGSR